MDVARDGYRSSSALVFGKEETDEFVAVTMAEVKVASATPSSRFRIQSNPRLPHKKCGAFVARIAAPSIEI